MQVLNALHNLCKINKRRQEQAAECGIIPHLMRFIRINSSLKQFALPLLCDMAHASRITRYVSSVIAVRLPTFSAGSDSVVLINSSVGYLQWVCRKNENIYTFE